MQMPTRDQLDRRLAAAIKGMRGMDANSARVYCVGERAWAETNWHPAVAKGFVDLLRAEYRKRFKK